ncbi:putative choline kinase 3 [Capsicum baccatum]|uniref:Choline kinase 3 n=1 Tax=Capsicum baccatum TaxID=33114 RepID=A0A2G2XDA6_CAPBA|nr:putative choline kinase 3 [Capsicum baccatum]
MATIEKGKFSEELVNILKSLALEWGDNLEEDIDRSLEISPLDGAGFLNKLYKIRWAISKEEYQSGDREVLVRIYGKGMEIFVNRKEEVATFEWLSQQGEGPKLYGCLPNGRVEEFIRGRTLFPYELRIPEISALVAAKVRKFHSLERPGPKHVIIWDRLRSWLSNAKKKCSHEHIMEFSLGNLEEEINSMENILSTESQVIAFCHNDLHYGNMLFNETTQSLTLIDYEFSGYNPIAYDFANYFCEMASDYYSDTPHLMDFSKYPGLEERHNFIRMYLTSAGCEPSELEVEQLADDAEKYTLASHLIYGLWGIISVTNAKNDDSFDYVKHARQRFEQYQLRRFKLFRAENLPMSENYD